MKLLKKLIQRNNIFLQYVPTCINTIPNYYLFLKFKVYDKINNKFLKGFPNLYHFIFNLSNFYKDYSSANCSKRIIEYVLEKKPNIRLFTEGLDQLSQEIIKMVLGRIYYYHSDDKLRKKYLFTFNDEILIQRESIDIMQHYEKKFYLPIKIYEISIFYFKCGLTFVPDDIIQELSNTDFIDGGAFVGDTALMFENFFDPREIHAFEPDLSNYKYIFDTIERNNLSKIVPVKIGLGNKEGAMKIETMGAGSSLSDMGDQKVNITTIDKYVFKNSLSVGLIKLDVEGHGLSAIKGAEKTILKFKPVILIAIYHNGEEFFGIKEYLENLELNYTIIIRKLNPHHPFLETMLIAW